MNESHAIGCNCVFCEQRDAKRTASAEPRMPDQPDFDAARKWAENAALKAGGVDWAIARAFFALESRVAALQQERDEAIALLTGACTTLREGGFYTCADAIEAFIAAHPIGI